MKTRYLQSLAALVAVLAVVVFLTACGQGSRHIPTLSVALQPQASAEQAQVMWPSGLPEDKLQPWEEMDANGYVVPPKAASNLNFDSIFASGIERHLEAGDVTDYGEASSFASGAGGGEEISYAIYRLPMGTDQPGTITADVNLHIGSGYYIGVGDYSVNTWHWHGPFDVTHVRFNVPDVEYTSGIGNLMLAVVAYDGASFDMVAIGANARDAADTEAPPIPAAPTLSPVAGGVLAEWIDVVADDLAGYRIYADGVEVLDYIEGGTSIVIPCADEVEVTLSAVDISGNESELSDPAAETPLVGEIPVVELTATAASGVRNDSITLTATGGENYDWDIDGDGVWDFTDEATNTKDADTSNLGVIRPAIRARTAEGGFSLSAVSLFITGNFRPVVLATADVTYGQAPLDVEFTIVAEDDDGTIDEYAWDFDGDGTFDGSTAANPSPLAHNYPDAGMYNAKFRVTDNDGAWAVDTVAVQVIEGLPPPPNIPPVAILLVNRSEVYLGQTGSQNVSFDATTSYDPEGTSLSYYFDLDGDGIFTYDEDGIYNYGFSDNGVYQCKVQVEDEGGEIGCDTAMVRVYRYNNGPVDTSGDVGSSNTSMTAVAGTPAIAYYNDANYDLMYVRAKDAGGNEWNPPLIAASSGMSGKYCSLTVVNGRPAVSYYMEIADELKFVRATDEYGTTWGSPETVDSAGNVGRYTSLRIVDSNPAISYQDISNGHLKYCRATDPDGTTWGAPIPVDTSGTCGDYTCLAVIGGNPAIAYQDYPTGSGILMYVRATDPSGSTWGTPVVVDSDPDTGIYNTLLQVIGRPAIAYHDGNTSYLKYVRATDSTGSTWGTPVTVRDTASFCDYCSICICDGKPAIAYREAGGVLALTRSENTVGSLWEEPVIVNGGGGGGGGCTFTSLAIINGRPAISSFDTLSDSLWFSIPRLN